MNLFKFIYTGILALSLVACTGSSNTETEAGAHAHNEESGNDRVSLLPKQMEVMGIQLGSFQEINLSTTIKASGQLELPPQNKASLSAMLGGRVKEVNVIEGQSVKKGQVLALLENPEFIRIQKEYIDAKNQSELLEKEFKRKGELFKDKITSTKNYEKSEADYLQSKNQFQATKAQLEMLGISPLSIETNGIISAIPVK